VGGQDAASSSARGRGDLRSVPVRWWRDCRSIGHIRQHSFGGSGRHLDHGVVGHAVSAESCGRRGSADREGLPVPRWSGAGVGRPPGRRVGKLERESGRTRLGNTWWSNARRVLSLQRDGRGVDVELRAEDLHGDRGRGSTASVCTYSACSGRDSAEAYGLTKTARRNTGASTSVKTRPATRGLWRAFGDPTLEVADVLAASDLRKAATTASISRSSGTAHNSEERSGHIVTGCGQRAVQISRTSDTRAARPRKRPSFGNAGATLDISNARPMGWMNG
jgi:hypothetical protein